MEEKKSKVNLVLVAIIIALLVIVGVLFVLIFKNKISNEKNDSKNEEMKEIVKNKNKNKKEEINIAEEISKNNLVYFKKGLLDDDIYSLDIENGEQKKVFSTKDGSYFNTIVYNDKLFYIDNWSTGEKIVSLDLKNGEQKTILTKETLKTNNIEEKYIKNFIIFDNKIFYLNGICNGIDEKNYCAVGLYDLLTSENKLIIDNLQNKLDNKRHFGDYYLSKYDSENNFLDIVEHGAGDGGVADLYTLDISKNIVKKIIETSYFEYSTIEEKNKFDEVVEPIFGKFQKMTKESCGDLLVKADEFLKKDNNGDYSFIGCMK